MIKAVLKAVSQILLSTLLLFLMLEIIFRFIGAPGASHFVEKVVIQEKLSPHKPKGEFRVFAYGESTMHGSHYGPTSSPARWLGAYLKDFLPDRNIRVVNFARIGHGSDFTYETFQSTLFYKPDLALFYLGHNDFLPGNRKDQVASEKGSVSYRLRVLLRKSYLISTVSRWVIQKRVEMKKERSDDQIGSEVIETSPLGIADTSTPPTDPFYAENVNFFKENILKIITVGERRHIPLFFYDPVSNIKDFTPFHSAHLVKLSPEELSHWEQLYHDGRIEQVQGNEEEALGFYRQAYKIDPTYADLSFRLGQGYFKKGDFKQAKRFFEEARDNDTTIFRAPRAILAVFEEFRKTKNIQWIDTEKILAGEAPGGIMGDPIVEDNVHFSIKGHALVGRATAQAIADRNLLAPRSEWQFARQRSDGAIAKEFGIDPPYMVSAYLMMANYLGSRFDHRILVTKKALDIDPLNTRGLRYLAWTYWLMGDQEMALETYRTLGETHPEALKEVFKLQPKIQKAFGEDLEKVEATKV